jgi:predicted nucleic acid-binding protein
MHILRLAEMYKHTIPAVDTLVVEMARRARLPLLTTDSHQRRLARASGVDLL